MIFTQQKSTEEIVKMLEGNKNIFLISCSGCAEVCETGGEKVCILLKEKLQQAGFNIVSCCNVDFMCNKLLVSLKISRYKQKINEADCILVLSCGIGVQSAAMVIEKPVYPANNTLYLGGFQGIWPSMERCAECGDCVLDLTGGICPITNCSKSLLNGPCGGAKNGKCEIDKELDCGWEKIYRRLESIGKLDNLRKLIKIRDYAKMFPKTELRKSIFYDIEK